MSANVRPAVDVGTLVSAIRQARDLIERRGYQPIWGKGGDADPLNISEALATSCAGDRELLTRARQSFSKTWGGPVDGLLSWETAKRRSKAEVITLFGTVLTRLENGDAHPTGSSPRRRGTGPRNT